MEDSISCTPIPVSFILQREIETDRHTDRQTYREDEKGRGRGSGGGGGGSTLRTNCTHHIVADRH